MKETEQSESAQRSFAIRGQYSASQQLTPGVTGVSEPALFVCEEPTLLHIQPEEARPARSVLAIEGLLKTSHWSFGLAYTRKATTISGVENSPVLGAGGKCREPRGFELTGKQDGAGERTPVLWLVTPPVEPQARQHSFHLRTRMRLPTRSTWSQLASATTHGGCRRRCFCGASASSARLCLASP